MYQYHPQNPGMLAAALDLANHQPLMENFHQMDPATQQQPNHQQQQQEGPYNNNHYSLVNKWFYHQLNFVSNSEKVPSSWPRPEPHLPALPPGPQYFQPQEQPPPPYGPMIFQQISSHPPPPLGAMGDVIPEIQDFNLYGFADMRLNVIADIPMADDVGSDGETPMIKNVWQGNLVEEFTVIRGLLPKYRYVAMDTEFPGVVIQNTQSRGLGPEGNQLETIRRNVDVLKLIQLGISFFDDDGQSPPGTSTWQFNFKFNLRCDMWAEKSIGLLQDAGMQFERHESEGIDPEDFCYFFLSSGLVLQEEVAWLTYHGGYDFGYLMRILRGQNLPTRSDFAEFMKTYFPTCYDLKVLLAGHPVFVGGLHDISVRLGLSRIGIPHQAGSDSLLTGKTFFKIKEKFFNNDESGLKHFNGKIYGLGFKFEECLSKSFFLQQESEVLISPPNDGSGLEDNGDESSASGEENSNNSALPENEHLDCKKISSLLPLSSGSV